MNRGFDKEMYIIQCSFGNNKKRRKYFTNAHYTVCRDTGTWLIVFRKSRELAVFIACGSRPRRA